MPDCSDLAVPGWQRANKSFRDGGEAAPGRASWYPMTGKHGRRGRAARKADAGFASADVASASVASDTDVRGSEFGASTHSASVVQGTAVNATPPDGTPVAAFMPYDAVVRRTKDGWRVGSDDLPDLTCAMILADLLAAEN